MEDLAHPPGEWPADEEPVPEALKNLKAGDEVPKDIPVPKRVAPGAQPNRITGNVGDERRQELHEAKERAGKGVHDSHNQGPPRTPEERLKRGVPYSESYFQASSRDPR